jgi:hypothetical protein
VWLEANDDPTSLPERVEQATRAAPDVQYADLAAQPAAGRDPAEELD